ncbi:hypothetical protein KDA08_05100, partial [Candidatus Saccharibacteria bacterium]|nr:hypothetical protein [Candidatus Saccharibacteria bacterium]
IFLLAFIAFQQVSTNRRDTARRADAGRFIAEVANYSGDAGGKIPGQTNALSIANFVNQYISSPWNDPNGSAYVNVAAEADVDVKSEFYFSAGRKCDGNTAVTGGPSDYAIVMGLEKGKSCRSTSQ